MENIDSALELCYPIDKLYLLQKRRKGLQRSNPQNK